MGLRAELRTPRVKRKTNASSIKMTSSARAPEVDALCASHVSSVSENLASVGGAVDCDAGAANRGDIARARRKMASLVLA